ncbi:MAG: SDR family oxidoreductase [Candidatus Thorarchaeota archaeon]|jgi:NAD(P)-dependent dehydrogenase (short-subunit alcohol dehydrogenase family)
MDGKVCIVTGASSGIGRETALGLAQQGGHVVMLVRDEERGNAAKEYIMEKSCSQSVDMMLCDLSSMKQVRQFSTQYKEKYNRLHVLINNAGAVISKREQTAEGFEKTFAVNYLAPVLLTQELLPLLKSSSPSRVINLTSGLHGRAKVNLDNLQSEGKYKGMNVYGSAKLMVVLFTYKMARELEGTGVACNVVSPGFVATNLGRSSGSRMNSIMFGMMKPFQLSPTEGAETSLYAATSPEIEGITGKHFAKSKEKESSEVTYDVDLQDKLWEITEKLLG